MNENDTAYRIFVSYIDKSREYYAAQGFERPYRWASHSGAPFAPLPKPLDRCRIGVVTTAMLMDGRESQPALDRPKKVAYGAASAPTPAGMFTEDLAWDKEATHTRDVGSFLPLDRLAECAAAGRIGSVSPRFYGAPTEYSQRQTREHDAPAILAMCREDGVDAVLLVGL